jgi:cytochrome b561
MSNKRANRPGTLGLITFFFMVFTALSPAALAAAKSAPTPEGMLPHFESWIALAIVLMAFVIAGILNARQPKARALGTLFGALSCWAVVAWFATILGTGVLENPKPYQAPMDAAKPVLLWLQAGIALMGGLLLFRVASRQLKSTQQLALTHANQVDRYGRVSRVLHWATAILFLSLIPMGIFASMIPEQVWYRTEYNVAHKTLGFVVLGLFVARVGWNSVSPRPALEASLKPAERKLAHGVHLALYALLIAIPVSGYVMTSLHGYSSFFFALELKPFLAESKAYIVWGLFHKYLLQYLVYLILGAHIFGALKHHYIDKHKHSLKRMVS